MPETYTLTDVARRLNITPQAAGQLARRARWPFTPDPANPRKKRFAAEPVDTYLATQNPDYRPAPEIAAVKLKSGVIKRLLEGQAFERNAKGFIRIVKGGKVIVTFDTRYMPFEIEEG